MIQVQIDAGEQGVEAVRIRHEGGRVATLEVLERLMPHIKAMTASVGRLTQGEPDRTPGTYSLRTRARSKCNTQNPDEEEDCV